MRLGVADTGPLNYLGLIGAIHPLPQLFETVPVPQVVCDQLRHPLAPGALRAWAAQARAWLDVRPAPDAANDDPAWRTLDAGERAALALARALNADLVPMDDRAGVAVAHQLGFAVTGTLGVLDLAA